MSILEQSNDSMQAQTGSVLKHTIKDKTCQTWMTDLQMGICEKGKNYSANVAIHC